MQSCGDHRRVRRGQQQRQVLRVRVCMVSQESWGLGSTANSTGSEQEKHGKQQGHHHPHIIAGIDVFVAAVLQKDGGDTQHLQAALHWEGGVCCLPCLVLELQVLPGLDVGVEEVIEAIQQRCPMVEVSLRFIARSMDRLPWGFPDLQSDRKG